MTRSRRKDHKGNLWTTSEVQEVVTEACAEERSNCLAAISKFPDAYSHLLKTFEQWDFPTPTTP